MSDTNTGGIFIYMETAMLYFFGLSDYEFFMKFICSEGKILIIYRIKEAISKSHPSVNKGRHEKDIQPLRQN